MNQEQVAIRIARRAIAYAHRTLPPGATDAEFGSQAISILATTVEALLRLAIHRRNRVAAKILAPEITSPESVPVMHVNPLAEARRDAEQFLRDLRIPHTPI